MTTGRRWSIVVAVAFACVAVVPLFQPVTSDDLRPDARPLPSPFVHYDATEVNCGSWAIRKHRHEPACYSAIRLQRILGHSIAIASIPVLLAGLWLFRPSARARVERRVALYAGFIVSVIGVLTLFRPLSTDYFDGPPALPRTGPHVPTYVALEHPCGTLVYRAQYERSRGCREIYVPNLVFGAAVVGAGLVIGAVGMLVFPRPRAQQPSGTGGSTPSGAATDPPGRDL